MLNYTITFSLIEWLAITGLVQSVLILVYIGFRVRQWRQATIAIAYFFFLAAAFGLQFALRLDDYTAPIRLALWLSWSMGPPLCYLLVLQVVQMTELPAKRHFLVLLSIPVALGLTALLAWRDHACGAANWRCAAFFDTLYWVGAMTGALAVLALWLRKNIFGDLWRSKAGRERYWLVMMLVVANILGLVVNFLRAGNRLDTGQADALLVTLGIAFVYLASTTLFRVYPPPVQLNSNPRTRLFNLTDEEKVIADKIRVLIERDKVYQEQGFSRADLAREVGASESTVSRVVNAAFGRSLPKLINECRIEDAKRLLHDHTIAIQVIAFESGFNSLASFNRVFREVTGETPTAYRTSHSDIERK